jgi:hypothetical protein
MGEISGMISRGNDIQSAACYEAAAAIAHDAGEVLPHGDAGKRKQRIGAALIRNTDEEDKYRGEDSSCHQRLKQYPEQSHDCLAVANGDFAARQHEHKFTVRPDVGQILFEGPFAVRLDDFDYSDGIHSAFDFQLSERTFQDGAETVTRGHS